MGLFTRRSRDRYHNLDDPAETWELERPSGRSQSSGKSGGSSKSRSGTGPSGGGAGGGDQSRSNLYLALVDGLITSSKSSSGYYCVSRQGVSARTFRVQVNRDGRYVTLGHFADAKAAARAFSASPEGRAKAAELCAAELAAELAEVRRGLGDQDGPAPLAHTAAEERMGRVRRLLEGFGLSAYAAAFESEGYDDLSFLLGMSGDERIGVAWAVGMSEEHAQVFVREMGSLSEMSDV